VRDGDGAVMLADLAHPIRPQGVGYLIIIVHLPCTNKNSLPYQGRLLPTFRSLLHRSTIR
jgi:hypothetical protein